jgi:hypothetical protein
LRLSDKINIGSATIKDSISSLSFSALIWLIVSSSITELNKVDEKTPSCGAPLPGHSHADLANSIVTESVQTLYVSYTFMPKDLNELFSFTLLTHNVLPPVSNIFLSQDSASFSLNYLNEAKVLIPSPKQLNFTIWMQKV